MAALRREYAAAGLEVADLDPDPLVQVRRWFDEAVAADVLEPNAMVLATADEHGAPSARTVLLKEVDDRGFVLYTNRTSRKGREMAANPRAALVVPWIALARQVVVQGEVEPVDDATSDAYFATRPRGSQVGAWASEQSSVLSGRDELEARFAAADARFTDDVPRPPHWGGYRVVPSSVELWQGRASRLHDRLRYRRTDDGWVVERLAP